jgi:hypothetical protein
MMIALPAALFGIVSVAYLASHRKEWLLNPLFLFVLINTVSFAGALPLLRADDRADVVHAWVFLISLVSFIGGGALWSLWKVHRRDQVDRWWADPTAVRNPLRARAVLFSLGLVSLLVSILYYRAVGYNLFWDSVAAFMTTGEGVRDFITLRISSYSGERGYYAPGYANQFKNVLFPMIVAYAIVSRHLGHRLLPSPILIGLAVFAVGALLGTGQRGPFVVAILGIGQFALAAVPRKNRARTVLAVASLGTVFLLASTLFLGRSVQRWAGMEDAVLIGREVVERVLVKQQESSVLAFRYVFTRPVAHGEEWLDGIKGVLPGHSGSSLGHQVFREAFGSLRGTMPVSTWGSIWHNFGLVGVLVVPMLMGLAYRAFYLKLLAGPKTLDRLLVYAYLSVLLGTWVSGGPMQLINNGVLAVIGLRFLLAPPLRQSFLWTHPRPYSQPHRS